MIENIYQKRIEQEAPEPTDPTEKLFFEIAKNQSLLIGEPEMITLPGKKKNKWDKRSTVPDFLIRENEQDDGIYVEVAKQNSQDGHKNRQRRVMDRAGLGARYVQLTGAELREIQSANLSLIGYIKSKL